MRGFLLRIAFVAQPFDRMEPPVRSGSLALWIYYAARQLTERGHSVVVFGNHGGLLSASRTESEGLSFVFTPTALNRGLNRITDTARRVGLLDAAFPEFARASHHAGYAWHVGRALQRHECDVVHIMNYSQFAPVIRFLNPHASIALHMQCEWLTQLPKAMIEHRLRSVDVLIGCSEYITAKIAERFPGCASFSYTVPNASEIVPAAEGSPKEKNVVLFVGRLSPEKGVHHLIRAFRLVLPRFPDSRLHLVGGIGAAPLDLLVGLSEDPHVAALAEYYQRRSEGGEDPYFRALKAEAGDEVGRTIWFHGHADHDRISSFYRESTVVVNPSLSESFGISLVEAMMHSRPVVATRVGGMPFTVVQRETGILVDPADPKALAQAICDVLGDPQLARQMGDAGRARAIESFSWEAAIDRLVNCYERTRSRR